MLLPRWVGWIVATGLAAAVAANATEQQPAAPQRHPLEAKGLVDPEGVLRELPAMIERARATRDNRDRALLELARANACRVVADWYCQRDAGDAARAAAQAAHDAYLEVRALIASARGSIALQDFSRAENLLGEAQRLLVDAPQPQLSADVFLAYSSLSYALGKHELAIQYADRGLVATPSEPDPANQARLLRNRARAEAQLGRLAAASTSLDQAQRLVAGLADPKLRAELQLERARIARVAGDNAAQVAAGDEVLRLAAQLRNSQLEGQGREALGLAAVDRGELDAAREQLEAARAAFHALKQERDELRVVRESLEIALGRHAPHTEVERLAIDLLALDKRTSEADRAKAAADFDARLQYAEREVELTRLKDEALLAAERAESLRRTNRLTAALIVLALGTLAVVVGFFVQQWRARRALADSEQRLRAVADNVPALIAHLDADERYLFINAFSERTFSLDAAHVIGRTLREVRGEANYAKLKEHAARALAGEQVQFEGETDIGDRHYAFMSNYVPDVGADGKVRGFFAVTYDITPLKLAERELARIARVDSLTGIANRRHFEERLDEALSRCRRLGNGLALLYLDIDRFKEINDTLGHAVGDEVICAFAQRLLSCVRQVDFVARLGGDEFVVLIENASDAAAAENVARKLIDRMREPVATHAGPVDTRVSIGIGHAVAPATAATLMALADRSLYEAKAAGRNTYRVAEHTVDTPPAAA